MAFDAINKLKKDSEQDLAAVIEYFMKNREDAANILEKDQDREEQGHYFYSK